MMHRTKLTISQIRTYNSFLTKCQKKATSERFARMYDRAKLHKPRNGHLVLKG
jgi:hypothetical protein